MVKHFYGFVGLPGNWVDDNDRSYPEKFFEGKEYEDRIFDNFFEMDKEFGHKNSLFGTRGLEPGDPNRTSKSFNQYNEKFGPMIVRVLKNETIKESIKRILKEETEIPIPIMRRLGLSKIPNLMKKYSIRDFKEGTKDSIINIAARNAAIELLPWHDEDGNDYDDNEYEKWVKKLTEYLIEHYGNETKEYFDKVLPSGSFDNDGNKYIFIKHSELRGGYGFSEAYSTWGELILNRGWWFIINWWDVKDKLDKIDEGKVLFLRPGEPQNTMGYYFSIQKNKKNLRESVDKISLGDTIRKQIDKLGLYEFMRLSGWSWSKIVSIIGVDFLTYKMMSEFIPAALNEIGAFGLGEINEDTILYNSNQDEVREINFLGVNRAIVDVWGGIDFQEHKGEFGVHYYNLPDNILEEVFDVVIRVYEENSDI